MNHNHLNTLCIHLDLDIQVTSPIRVYGGLLHSMWRIDTDQGSYAVKQISKDVDLTNATIVQNYNSSEHVAERFADFGVPAISAMQKSGKYLTIIDGTGFLVYPWVEAKALDRDTVSESHAIKIAAILAKIHQINLDEPKIVPPIFSINTDKEIVALVEQAERFDCPFTEDLRKYLDDILSANQAYQNAIPILESDTVVSHGDLDQKNVLWDSKDNPVLIDWESAQRLNPTYEIINSGLDWSGIITNFNQEVFVKMLRAYQDAGGVINKYAIEAAFAGCLGNWLNWLLYNIKRSCKQEELEQIIMGVKQVNQTLATILRLQKIMPKIIRIIEGK